VIKAALAPLVLSLCFCVPALGERTVISVDSSAIKQEIRNAVRDLQIQIPELLKAVRVKVEMSEIQVRIPQIRVQVPEILIPAIRLQIPVNVQIPEIQLPEIHVQIPQIDVQVPKSPD
jgi:hypothetical protein